VRRITEGWFDPGSMPAALPGLSGFGPFRQSLGVAYMVSTATLALMAVATTTELVGQEFQVDLNVENTVRFLSRATIEDFEGVTDRVDGFVLLSTPRLEPGLGGEGTEFYFEVDLADLDTGIKLRNRHMRDNYLEVRDYPYATLEGSLGSVQVMPDGGFRIAIVGMLGIHGVSNRVAISCTASEQGAGYRVACDWEVLLSDYDIEVPRVMFMKLANEIRIQLEFTLMPVTSGLPETAAAAFRSAPVNHRPFRGKPQ
jgi:polyisoprenoid-binding protein YceI